MAMSTDQIKEALLYRINNPNNPKGYTTERAAELAEIIWLELGKVVTTEAVKTALDELRDCTPDIVEEGQ